jgi:hypothetical protein
VLTARREPLGEILDQFDFVSASIQDLQEANDVLILQHDAAFGFGEQRDGIEPSTSGLKDARLPLHDSKRRIGPQANPLISGTDYDS